MNINWKWPADPNSDFKPWYLILWGLIFSPMVLIGVGMAYLGFLLGQGPSTAKNFWRNVW